MTAIEVEVKFPITGNRSDLPARLVERGALAGRPQSQRDEYFSHPSRDFVQTGEAFRLRCVAERNALTYKGPHLDSETKTRLEIEVDFAGGPEQSDRMRSLLEALGFRSVRIVEKTRTTWHLRWEGIEFELLLDEVTGLGEFLEIETMASEADWQSVRDILLRLAQDLGLERSERRSYLELLIERDKSHG